MTKKSTRFKRIEPKFTIREKKQLKILYLPLPTKFQGIQVVGEVAILCSSTKQARRWGGASSGRWYCACVCWSWMPSVFLSTEFSESNNYHTSKTQHMSQSWQVQRSGGTNSRWFLKLFKYNIIPLHLAPNYSMTSIASSIKSEPFHSL